MKLTYAVTFDDFKSLQAPFPVRAGNNVGFKAVLIACGLMGLLGVYVILEGMGLPVGLFLIGLGIVAGMAASLYEKRSVRANQKKYEDKLERAFQQVHCRDERVLATDDAGFTVSCKCGTVTRPWSEVNSFSENETVFTIITKMGGQSYPKSAFSSQAQITEFRALVSGKLAQDKPATAPHFAYALKPEDYRAAYWLHTLKGGGWRGLAKALATYACILYGTFVIWNSIAANNVPVRAGLVGALVGLPLLAMMKKRRKEFFGQVRVYFSDEGLHMQYPSAQLRKPWSQFIGYLENDKIVLLYLSPKLYNTIPKRALTGPAARFRAMAEAKLAPYDYRNPAPKLNSSPQQAS